MLFKCFNRANIHRSCRASSAMTMKNWQLKVCWVSRAKTCYPEDDKKMIIQILVRMRIPCRRRETDRVGSVHKEGRVKFMFLLSDGK